MVDRKMAHFRAIVLLFVTGEKWNCEDLDSDTCS
jgi:hypothetical protein